jgi:hypothetical protein
LRFHGGDYEECLLGYKNPVLTSEETHHFPTTEFSWLMLCQIWGFHGSDYEECRLLGYKNPVHTSKETHYVSATESSQLTLFKIEVFTAVTMKNGELSLNVIFSQGVPSYSCYCIIHFNIITVFPTARSLVIENRPIPSS